MCGLCGLNDGDKTNDFKTSQGSTVTSADKATFGNSWKQTAVGSKCSRWGIGESSIDITTNFPAVNLDENFGKVYVVGNQQAVDAMLIQSY